MASNGEAPFKASLAWVRLLQGRRSLNVRADMLVSSQASSGSGRSGSRSSTTNQAFFLTTSPMGWIVLGKADRALLAIPFIRTLLFTLGYVAVVALFWNLIH